jgi:RNA polymerase sigma-70 factor (ECF subfamily)
MSVPVPSTPHALDRLAERELIECAKRDPLAFGELYRRYHSDVAGFAYTRLRSLADTEDVTSDVFLRAFRAIGRYEDRGVPFRVWLFRITANAVVDHVRQQRPVEDLDECRTLPATGRSFEDVATDRDQVRRIGHAARQLHLCRRQAFALRFGQDLAVNEVARRMGRTPGAVKLLLHRAVGEVRTALQAEPAMELAS